MSMSRYYFRMIRMSTQKNICTCILASICFYFCRGHVNFTTRISYKYVGTTATTAESKKRKEFSTEGPSTGQSLAGGDFFFRTACTASYFSEDKGPYFDCGHVDSAFLFPSQDSTKIQSPESQFGTRILGFYLLPMWIR